MLGTQERILSVKFERLVKYSFRTLLLSAVIATVSCQGPGEWIRETKDGMGPAVTDGIVVEPWGQIDGVKIQRFTLDNGRMRVRIIDYGATVTECLVPGPEGEMIDIVLGFDDLAGYIERSQYFGCIVGRCANRIDSGKFTLDGTEYALATNNGDHHLHGGVKGFDKSIWGARPLASDDGIGIELLLTSADGDEGYPGEVHATVRYTLTDDDVLRVEMTAETDRATPVNLAHHSYWNLAGHSSGSMLDQLLTLNCSRYTAGENLIPTGEIAPVSGTALDFTSAKAIGTDIAALPGSGDGDPGGYDHNFVIDGFSLKETGTLRFAARASDRASGNSMEIWTDQPGIQFYSGNFLDGVAGKKGAVYQKHGAFCLESQLWPDAINKQDNGAWPSVILQPGSTYRHTMEHRFLFDGGA